MRGVANQLFRALNGTLAPDEAVSGVVMRRMVEVRLDIGKARVNQLFAKWFVESGDLATGRWMLGCSQGDRATLPSSLYNRCAIHVDECAASQSANGARKRLAYPKG
jgi:hypothetical protein